MFASLSTCRLVTYFVLGIVAVVVGQLTYGVVILMALSDYTDLSSARSLIQAGLTEYDYALRYEGVYVRRDSGNWISIEAAGRYSGRTNVVEVLASGDGKPATFLLKSPVVVVSEMAGELSKHEPTRTLRVLSLSATEAELTKMPDAFEARAIEVINKSGRREFSGLDTAENSFRVIRLISLPGHSPLYLSAAVSHSTPAILWALLPPHVWIMSVCVIALLVLLVWVIHHFVVVRIGELADFAQMISSSQVTTGLNEPQYNRDEASSKNEIHHLSFALKALYNSTLTAMRYLNPERRRATSGRDST